jgi:hypothetical protein
MGSERRYPLEALVEASGLTEAALGRAVGLSGSTLGKARRHGLREDAADRYAVRAGLHPLEVWTDFGQVPCAECDGLFAPTRKGHRFCSRLCADRLRSRERYRRNYASSPEFRAAEVERAKRFALDNARARRITRARHYQENKHLWVEWREQRKAAS